MKRKALALPGNSTTFIRLFLLMFVLMLFWPLTDNGFINFDDPDYITENRWVRDGLTPESIYWAFSHSHAGNWHPLTWLSHMLDVEVFGLNPGGHHLTSLLLHALNTVLLFTLLHAMTGCLWRSAIVGALFAVHPLHVESVAWAAERKDVLSSTFWFLTMGAYLRYVRAPSLGEYSLVCIFFLLGLMAKPMLVTLPLILLLLDYWPLSRFSPTRTQKRGGKIIPVSLIREKLPLFMLSAVSAAITILVQKKAGAVGTLVGFPLSARIGNALVSYAEYLKKMVWPLDLSVFYPHPGWYVWWKPTIALLLLAVFTRCAIRWAKTRPYVFLGWFWYAIALLPVIGLVQVGAQAMADRYTYIPLVGLFIGVVWVTADGMGKHTATRITVSVITVAVILCFSLITRLQVQVWNNDISLYRHSLKVTQNNYFLLNNLGLALADRGQIDEAVSRYRQALAIDPNYKESHNNLGNALLKKGALQDAMQHYHHALRIFPDDAMAHYNLGVAFEKMGNADAAVAQYQKALHIDPMMEKANNNLGNAYLEAGRIPEAMDHYRLALKHNPHNAQTRYNIGVAYERLNRPQLAVGSYREALALDDQLVQAHNNLGSILLKQGSLLEACTHFTLAILIDPQNPELHFNLSVGMERLGRIEDADFHIQEALRLKPGFIQAHMQMGMIRMKTGRFDDAARHFNTALNLDPGNKTAANLFRSAEAASKQHSQ